MSLTFTAPFVVHADVIEHVVQVRAEVRENLAHILFSWPSDISAQQYYVSKKSKMDTSWGDPTAVQEGSAVQFADSDIQIGETYEYGFYNNPHSFADTVTVAHRNAVTFSIYDS